MKAFVFKPSNDLIGTFAIDDTSKIREAVIRFAEDYELRPYDYIECSGRTWTLVSLTEGVVLEDGRTQKPDSVVTEPRTSNRKPHSNTVAVPKWLVFYVLALLEILVLVLFANRSTKAFISSDIFSVSFWLILVNSIACVFLVIPGVTLSWRCILSGVFFGFSIYSMQQVGEEAGLRGVMLVADGLLQILVPVTTLVAIVGAILTRGKTERSSSQETTTSAKASISPEAHVPVVSPDCPNGCGPLSSLSGVAYCQICNYRQERPK